MASKSSKFSLQTFISYCLKSTINLLKFTHQTFAMLLCYKSAKLGNGDHLANHNHCMSRPSVHAVATLCNIATSDNQGEC